MAEPLGGIVITDPIEVLTRAVEVLKFTPQTRDADYTAEEEAALEQVKGYREALRAIADGRWNVGSGKPLKGVSGVIDSARSFARAALTPGSPEEGP